MKKIDHQGRQCLRSQRSRVSDERRREAKLCERGEFVALESKDNEDGFTFWLAQVSGVAYQYCGSKTTKDGVVLKPGGWYISVVIYDRFPASSSSTFRSCVQSWTVDAEGVVVRNVVVQGKESRRSTRSRASSSSGEAQMVRMEEDEVKRIEDLCLVKLDQ